MFKADNRDVQAYRLLDRPVITAQSVQQTFCESGTGRCSDNRCSDSRYSDNRYSDKVESTGGSVHDFWAGRLSAKGLNGNGSCWNYCSGNIRKRNDPTISAV